MGDDQRAERRQELEVRLTVQRLLREHAHSGPLAGGIPSPRYWGDDLDVDLTGAALHNVDLSGRRVHPRTSFHNVTFGGNTSFLMARFGGPGSGGSTLFGGVTFGGDTSFFRAKFSGNTTFVAAKFGGPTSFSEAKFSKVTFSRATFSGKAGFVRTTFGRDTSFSKVAFREATFNGDTLFQTVAPVLSGHVWPTGWELQPAGEVPVPLAVIQI